MHNYVQPSLLPRTCILCRQPSPKTICSACSRRVSWECRMRIRPQRSSIGYGFLLGAVVTVDVLLIAAILALHALQAWLAH